MTKIIAITGGIGSGKTTISNMFSDKGVPVFNSDEIAKEIMSTNSLLKNEIVTAFGNKVYDKNKLNKGFRMMVKTSISEKNKYSINNQLGKSNLNC